MQFHSDYHDAHDQGGDELVRAYADLSSGETVLKLPGGAVTMSPWEATMLMRQLSSARNQATFAMRRQRNGRGPARLVHGHGVGVSDE